MNAAITMYEEQEFSYSMKNRPSTPKRTPFRTNRPSYGRRSRSNGPQSFNGIHLRRSKKIRW